MSDRRLRLDLRVLGDLPLGGHKTVAGRRAFEVTAIGRVQSSLIDPSSAPEQGDEGAPDAWIVVDAIFGQRLGDLRAGDEILVLSARFAEIEKTVATKGVCGSVSVAGSSCIKTVADTPTPQHISRPSSRHQRTRSSAKT